MVQLYKWARRSTVIVTAGMLFQTSGCAVDGQALITQVAALFIQNLIGTFVFGSFNLVP